MNPTLPRSSKGDMVGCDQPVASLGLGIARKSERSIARTQLMLRPCALVTGASSGIGRAFAQRLARDGFHLILVARRQERLVGACREIETLGATAEIVVADLTIPEGLTEVEKRAAAGDLTTLVNNAGFQAYRPFVELDPDLAEAQLYLHTTVPVRLCRAALPAMLARGDGAIVNVSSMLAFSAGMDQPYLPKRADLRRHESVRQRLHRDACR